MVSIPTVTLELLCAEVGKRIAKAAADREAARQAELAETRVKRSADAAARPKSVPKRRREIFEKSGGKCHYCGVALALDGAWHIEHMQPKALLGSNQKSNLVASCVPCNSKKRDMTAEEFIAKRTREQEMTI